MFLVWVFVLHLGSYGGDTLRIITRGMIRGPGIDTTPGEMILQPVLLKTKQDKEIITTTPQTERLYHTTIGNVEKHVEETTTFESIEETTKAIKTKDRLNFQPVARQWHDTDTLRLQKGYYDLWKLLRTAYYCLFSGLDCFSRRLYPMFKSYLGYADLPTTFLMPRDKVLNEVPRSLSMAKLLKDIFLVILILNFLLIPWLGGLGLATGKALLTGILGLGAAGAFVWERHRGAEFN